MGKVADEVRRQAEEQAAQAAAEEERVFVQAVVASEEARKAELMRHIAEEAERQQHGAAEEIERRQRAAAAEATMESGSSVKRTVRIAEEPPQTVFISEAEAAAISETFSAGGNASDKEAVSGSACSAPLSPYQLPEERYTGSGPMSLYASHTTLHMASNYQRSTLDTKGRLPRRPKYAWSYFDKKSSVGYMGWNNGHARFGDTVSNGITPSVIAERIRAAAAAIDATAAAAVDVTVAGAIVGEARVIRTASMAAAAAATDPTDNRDHHKTADIAVISTATASAAAAVASSVVTPDPDWVARITKKTGIGVIDALIDAMWAAGSSYHLQSRVLDAILAKDQKSIREKYLSKVQRRYLASKRVINQITTGMLTVQEAIASTSKKNMDRLEGNHRLEAVCLGYSPKEVRFHWFVDAHYIALKNELLPYDELIYFDDHHIMGMCFGLTRKQVTDQSIKAELAKLLYFLQDWVRERNDKPIDSQELCQTWEGIKRLKLTDVKLDGMFDGYTLEQVTASWFSRKHMDLLRDGYDKEELIGLDALKLEALELGIDREDLLKCNRFEQHHLDAIKDCMKFSDIVDLESYQINAILRGVSREKVIGLDALKLEALILRVDREELLRCNRFERHHLEAIKDGMKFSDIVNLEPYQIKAMKQGYSRKEVETIKDVVTLQCMIERRLTQDEIKSLEHFDQLCKGHILTILQRKDNHSSYLYKCQNIVHLEAYQLAAMGLFNLTLEQVDQDWFSRAHLLALYDGDSYMSIAGRTGDELVRELFPLGPNRGPAVRAASGNGLLLPAYQQQVAAERSERRVGVDMPTSAASVSFAAADGTIPFVGSTAGAKP